MELDDREFCVPALHLSACLVLGATRCFRKGANSQVPRATHGASGETRNFQSLACPRRRARRSPVPPLDQLRVPPARRTLFALQRARKPSCKLDIIAAALCAARRKCSKPAE